MVRAVTTASRSNRQTRRERRARRRRTANAAADQFGRDRGVARCARRRRADAFLVGSFVSATSDACARSKAALVRSARERRPERLAARNCTDQRRASIFVLGSCHRDACVVGFFFADCNDASAETDRRRRFDSTDAGQRQRRRRRARALRLPARGARRQRRRARNDARRRSALFGPRLAAV